MSNNDALRKALGKVKAAQGAHPMAVPVLLEEAQELIEEALAASKPEPQAQLPPNEQFYRDSLRAAVIERSKPEPQEQAGEPEVVAWVTDADVRDFGKGPGESAFCFTRHGKWNVPLITIQSHREAMAKAHADLQEKALQYVALFWQLQEAREEIAKKDAALKSWPETYAAFVGAFDTPMERRRNNSDFAKDARKRMRDFNDAITQTLEAMK